MQKEFWCPKLRNSKLGWVSWGGFVYILLTLEDSSREMPNLSDSHGTPELSVSKLHDCSMGSVSNRHGQVLVWLKWESCTDGSMMILGTSLANDHISFSKCKAGFLPGKNLVLLPGICPPSSSADPKGKEWLRNSFFSTPFSPGSVLISQSRAVGSPLLPLLL